MKDQPKGNVTYNRERYTFKAVSAMLELIKNQIQQVSKKPALGINYESLKGNLISQPWFKIVF